MTKKYRMIILTIIMIFMITNFTNAQKADLVIRIKCPGKAMAGQDLKTSIKVFVTNKGNVAAKNFPVDLIISRDANAMMKFAVYSAAFKEDALLLGGREFVEDLGPGQTKAVKLNGNNRIPANTQTGSYFLGAIVDAGNSVVESDNLNNMDFCRMKIKGKGSPPFVLQKAGSSKLKDIHDGTSNTIVKKNAPSSSVFPVPIPYPNLGMAKPKDPTVRKIKIRKPPPPPPSPKSLLHNKCPDPAAHAILFKLVKRTSKNTGLVRITGIVKNLGSGKFSGRGGRIYIYEGNRVKMSRPLLPIEPGKLKAFSFKRNWKTSSKYSPMYHLIIKYENGDFSEQNKNKNDCDLKNNKKSRSGAEINKLF